MVVFGLEFASLFVEAALEPREVGLASSSYAEMADVIEGFSGICLLNVRLTDYSSGQSWMWPGVAGDRLEMHA